MLTEDQLKAFETNAPLLVAEYRGLARQLELANVIVDRTTALARRLIFTIRSGIIAASNVEAMTTEAEHLGIYKRP